MFGTKLHLCPCILNSFAYLHGFMCAFTLLCVAELYSCFRNDGDVTVSYTTARCELQTSHQLCVTAKRGDSDMDMYTELDQLDVWNLHEASI